MPNPAAEIDEDDHRDTHAQTAAAAPAAAALRPALIVMALVAVALVVAPQSVGEVQRLRQQQQLKWIFMKMSFPNSLFSSKIKS